MATEVGWEAAAEEHRREARELRAEVAARDDAPWKLEVRACVRAPPPPPAAAVGVRAGPSGRRAVRARLASRRRSAAGHAER